MISSGVLTPAITPATSEWTGLIEATTFTSALACLSVTIIPDDKITNALTLNMDFIDGIPILLTLIHTYYLRMTK